MAHLALILLFVFPSLGIVYKFFSLSGACLYSLTVATGVLAFHGRAAGALSRKISPVQARFLMALTLIALIILFSIVYPMINTDLPGRGTDRDEDLTIATQALLHGQYPFYAQTYLGNHITHFPGSLFLAVPFVLSGNGAYQNFFWLALFLVIAARYLKDARRALLLFWEMILFSPQLIYEMFTGGDLIANGIYPLVFVFLLVSSLERSRRLFDWKVLIFALLLGVGISSRSGFLFLLPLLASLLYQNFGFRKSAVCILATCLSYLAVTAPFYFYDPAGFSPLSGQFSKLSQFPGAPAFMAPAVLAGAAAITLALCFQRMALDLGVFLRNCVVAQLALILPVVVAGSAAGGSHRFILSSYALIFFFFGVLAFGRKEISPSSK